MMKFKVSAAIAAICVIFSGIVMAAPAETPTTTPTPAAATPEDPIKMLKSVTDNVLKALKDNSAAIDAQPNKIYAVVDKYILPYVDFNEMSTWVAGRTAWGKASEKTRDNFVSEFQVLVIRTYATALKNYKNETVYFAPQKVDTTKDRIQISSTIVRTSKENINLNYRLVKRQNKWLVYDVIIEGVSILQGFQAQFTNEIRQKGLEPVIAQIKEHNKKGSA